MKFSHKISHLLLMAVGCVAMLLAVFAFTSTTGTGSWGIYLLLLLCPAMHFLMHRGSHGSEKGHEMPRDQLLITGKEVPVEEQTKSPEKRNSYR